MRWGRRSRGACRDARRALVPVLVGACLVAALRASSAPAAPNLFVGVTDDAFRWRAAEGVAVARDLGLKAIRPTVAWSAGQTALTADQRRDLDTLVTAAAGLRIVITVTGTARSAPRDSASRATYCGFVRALLERYPTVNDIVIWNEPNLGYFWQPQFGQGRASVAPAAYAALLAECWDALHGERSDVNVVTTTSPRGSDDPAAVVNPAHSPGSFVRKLGAAYRASGRKRPLFDTVGHNPYGSSSSEPPWQAHLAATHIAQGDLDRLVDAYAEGFRDTMQPVPGRCIGGRCASIWYLEAGYQTSVPPGRAGYTGRENDARPVGPGSPTTQSAQLVDGIRLAYCQPYVTAFFNFLLWDERELARWQSGVLWVDGDRKPSYDALRGVAAEVNEGRTDCAALRARASARPSLPRGDALVERLEWPSVSSFSAFNDVWWFGLGVRVDSRYRAAVVRLGAAARPAALRVSGIARARRPRVVRFPVQTLQPGRYRIEVVVTRLGRPRTSVMRRGPAFTVE